MDDPRVERSQRHSLVNIIVILAVICSADTWVDIAFFGQRKQHWLRTSLDLTHSILSHDTFGGSLHGWMQHTVGRLFPALVQSLATVFQGQVVALDGKTVRHSHCRAGGDDNVAPLHMVHAWVLSCWRTNPVSTVIS